MKYFLGLLILASALLSLRAQSSRLEIEIENERQQVILWGGVLAEAASLTGHEKVDKLSLGLRNMAHRRTFPGHSESVDFTYLRIQSLLLEVPDHAQYIASKIEKERESVKHLPPNTGERLDYDSRRNAHFGTLAHLPSPSSIKILGEYLYDDRDVALITPLKDGMTCISGGSSGNSYHSADALIDLGIRQPPQKKIGIVNVPDVAAWKAWYEEVKEGRRAFSFVGQKVEYRFKSDGTWETTPLTISDVALREELKQATPAPFAATLPLDDSFMSGPATYSRWPWIAAGAAILITMGAWFFLKSRTS